MRAQQACVLGDLAAAGERWAAAGGHSPGVTIGTRHYAGEGYRKEAAAALERVLEGLRRDATVMGAAAPVRVLGAYLGFDLRASLHRDGLARESSIALHVVGRASHEVTFGGVVSEGTLASLEAQIHPRRLEQVADTLAADLQRLEHRHDGLRQEAARPFDDGAQLLVLRQQRDVLVERLHLKDGRQEAIVLEAAVEPDREPGREVGREPVAIELERTP